MIFNNRVDVFEENKRLREELEQERRLRKEWQERCSKLEQELRDVKAVLNRILNPDTPSSQIPDTEKETNRSPSRDPVGSRPRGKPSGGNGATKEAPTKVHRKLNATRDSCTQCRGKNLQHIDTEEALIWDLPIIQLIVTLFYVFVYRCKDCGALVRGTHPELPTQGMIGPNLAAFLAEIKHNFAASYEKISSFLFDVTGETFSAQAINDCIIRTASRLEPKYKEIEEMLLKESVLHSDETRWPVNGDKWFLWLFVTVNFVFITIHNSRAKKVLINIFGEDYHGGIISDCYRAYDGFAEWFQKCWAHLLRKAKFESEKHPRKNVVKLYGQLCRLHQEMSDFLKENPSTKRRLKAKKKFAQKLNAIINYSGWCKEAQKIVDNWLIAYRNHWLTAIEVEGINLDNNLCERKIRRSIGWRKMLGGHRTGEGARQYAIIQTMRETWKHQEKRPYNELLAVLKN